MKHAGIRYVSLAAVLGFIFINFIACGSQFYQVSVKDDFDENKAPPEASDPQSNLYGIHAPKGWTTIPINYKFGQTINAQQKAAIVAAMQTWEKAIGRQLFQLSGTDGSNGDSFPDLYSSLGDGVNGHYLDNNWAKNDKAEVVLATTIWDSPDTSTIQNGDIRFNNQFYILGDSLYMSADETKEIVDMESLALHEIGHLIGLAHVTADVDPNSIMNPSLFIGEGLTSRFISRGDIVRIQTIYGCEGEACNVDKLVQEFQYAMAEAEQN